MSNFLIIEVNDSAFQDELFHIHNRFILMVQTMVDISNLIWAYSKEYVPLDTGRLEESFHYTVDYQSDFEIIVRDTYDAVDPDYGFHYAKYQHDLTRRGIGTYSRYTRASSGYYNRRLHHRHGVRGTDHYLKKGVDWVISENLMWTVIEQDYLSLFTGGL